jgi:hypothetical protein
MKGRHLDSAKIESRMSSNRNERKAEAKAKLASVEEFDTGASSPELQEPEAVRHIVKS